MQCIRHVVANQLQDLCIVITYKAYVFERSLLLEVRTVLGAFIVSQNLVNEFQLIILGFFVLTRHADHGFGQGAQNSEKSIAPLNKLLTCCTTSKLSCGKSLVTSKSVVPGDRRLRYLLEQFSVGSLVVARVGRVGEIQVKFLVKARVCSRDFRGGRDCNLKGVAIRSRSRGRGDDEISIGAHMLIHGRRSSTFLGKDLIVDGVVSTMMAMVLALSPVMTLMAIVVAIIMTVL